VGIISGPPEANLTLPAITGWKSMDGLPEKATAYDDSSAAWKIANDTTTMSPTTPLSLPVLYTDQYGFHTGVTLYRARISGNATAITLGVQGGTAL